MMTSALVTALGATLLTISVQASPDSDPLFARMQGRWVGRGERVQLMSGRRVSIEAQVESRVEGARLLSRNEIRETNPDGATRVYSRVYWLEPQASEDGRYRLCADSHTPAEGRFDGETFTVRQDFGTQSGLRVESVTRFPGDGVTDYRERLLHADQVLSETRIEYTRI